VFNMKRSPYDFNFCLAYASISSVGNWAFFNPKNHSHLVSIGHDFNPLVLCDNLNGRGADSMHLLQD
jgi:hypothetical protein